MVARRNRKAWVRQAVSWAVAVGIVLLVALAVSLASPRKPAPNPEDPPTAVPTKVVTQAPAPVPPAALTPSPPPNVADLYRVVKVTDGDTLDVVPAGLSAPNTGKLDQKTLRLIGMDTPEVVDPRKPVQCFGRAASQKAHELLDGQVVRLELDPSQGTLDRYDRTLAYIYLPDGTNYAEWMIRHGYAHEYTYQRKAYKYQSQFKAAEREASTNQLGFWTPSTCAGDTQKADPDQSRR